ncbi:hypothetical protein ACFFX0_30570 [Citricoccus parietis]|uniref:Uncharacterized protein n=1 Tax=Citricoccus parietis TaxID=592307 RepID=A0ABV5G8K2_9MICC
MANSRVRRNWPGGRGAARIQARARRHRGPGRTRGRVPPTRRRLDRERSRLPSRFGLRNRRRHRPCAHPGVDRRGDRELRRPNRAPERSADG